MPEYGMRVVNEDYLGGEFRIKEHNYSGLKIRADSFQEAAMKSRVLFDIKARLLPSIKMVNVTLIGPEYEEYEILRNKKWLIDSDGEFNRAEEAMKKAFSQANSVERENIYFEVKHFYKEQARKNEEVGKRASVVRIYEKLLEMRLGFQERKEIKEKLLGLYEKLGERRKYDLLKGKD